MFPDSMSALLPDGTIGDLSLKNALGSHVFIYFYPGDFLNVSREELKELSDLHDQFRSLRTNVFACGSATSQMHQSWVETSPRGDFEGLGFQPPFPILGDSQGNLSKSFDMFDDEAGSVKHGFILLNESGHVKYKEIVDIDVKYDVGLALATVKRIIMFKEMKDKISKSEDLEVPDGPPPLPENPPPETSEEEEEEEEENKRKEDSSEEHVDQDVVLAVCPSRPEEMDLPAIDADVVENGTSKQSDESEDRDIVKTDHDVAVEVILEPEPKEKVEEEPPIPDEILELPIPADNQEILELPIPADNQEILELPIPADNQATKRASVNDLEEKLKRELTSRKKADVDTDNIQPANNATPSPIVKAGVGKTKSTKNKSDGCCVIG